MKTAIGVYPENLWHHIGKESSLAGKVQKIKVIINSYDRRFLIHITIGYTLFFILSLPILLKLLRIIIQKRIYQLR